jgi:hypothetical protein
MYTYTRSGVTMGGEQGCCSPPRAVQNLSNIIMTLKEYYKKIIRMFKIIRNIVSEYILFSTKLVVFSLMV